MDTPKPERERETLILPSRRDGFCLSTNSLLLGFVDSGHYAFLLRKPSHL